MLEDMEAPEDEKPAGIGRLRRGLFDWLRNWRLRSWRTALLGLWIAWLIVGFLVIPLIVRKLLIENLRKQAGLEATVRSVRFNPFTLSLTIEGLSIPDRRGSVLFSADEIYANAELSSLFRWAATLSEFRMVNPVIGARRFADGRINLAEVVEEVRRRQPPRPPNPKSSLPRVLLQHIKISGATINVEDQARAKPLKMAFGPSVFELSEISTIPKRQGTKEIAIRLPGSGVVRATGSVTVQPLGLEGDVRLEELHLKELWPLLEPYFQFTVESGELTGRFHYTIAAADGKVRARITDFENALKDLTVVNEGDRVLELPAAAITKGSFRWPEAELVVERVRLERPSVLVRRDADGKMSWERMVPPPTREVVAQTYQEIEKAAPWTVDVGRFEVVDSRGRFQDRTLDPPVSLDAGDIQLAITGFTTRPGAFFGVVSSSSLPKGGTTKSSGRVSMKPVQFEADVALDGLDLTVAQPYLGRLFPFEILSGTRGLEGKSRGRYRREEGLLGEVRRRSGCPDDGAARDGHGLDAPEVGRRAGPGRRGRIRPHELTSGSSRSTFAARESTWSSRRTARSVFSRSRKSWPRARRRIRNRLTHRRHRRRRRRRRPRRKRKGTRSRSASIRSPSPTVPIALTDHRLRPPYTVAVERIQGTVKGISPHPPTTGPGADRDRRGCARRRGGDVQGSDRSLPARPCDRPEARRAADRDPAPVSHVGPLPRLSGHQGSQRPRPRLQDQRPTPEGQQSHRDPGPDARRQGRRRREGESPDQARRLPSDGQGRPHHARRSRRGPPRRPEVRGRHGDRRGDRGGRFRAHQVSVPSARGKSAAGKRRRISATSSFRPGARRSTRPPPSGSGPWRPP